MILPQIKNYQEKNEVFALPLTLTLSCPEEDRARAEGILPLFFPDLVVKSGEEKAQLTLEKGPMECEAYEFTVQETGITVTYGDVLGMRHALGSLATLCKRVGEEYLIPLCNAADRPDVSWRGGMLDLARGVRPFPMLMEDVVLMAKAKYNVLHLHLTDSKGVCFESDTLPVELRLENAYTKEQMASLMALAELFGMTVVPEFDVPAHAKRLTALRPELGCEVEDNTHWTLCAGSEEVFDLIEKVIAEFCELFPSPYFHIGSDELTFGKNVALRQLCHWDECPRCRRRMEEEGLKDRQELFYYLILRVYHIVKKHGRQMIMWSDQLDCNRPSPLPRDIIMHFWRVAGEGNGPRENCSMEKQLEMGYYVINSTVSDTYIDTPRFLTSEKIRDWRPYTRPDHVPQYRDRILGSEFCAWEYGNAVRYPHYDRSFAPSALLMADRLWNDRDQLHTPVYAKALTRAVLGPTCPDHFNVFGPFGDLIPPRTTPPHYTEISKLENVTLTPDEVIKIAQTLKTLTPTDHGSRERVRCLAEAIEIVHALLTEKAVDLTPDKLDTELRPEDLETEAP